MIKRFEQAALRSPKLGGVRIMQWSEQYHARRAAIEAAAAARAITPEARARRLALAALFASKASADLTARDEQRSGAIAA